MSVWGVGFGGVNWLGSRACSGCRVSLVGVWGLGQGFGSARPPVSAISEIQLRVVRGSGFKDLGFLGFSVFRGYKVLGVQAF